MTIAQTRSGKVRGEDIDGVLVFKGIPYASPPVGERRWLPPIKEEAWDGERDATQFSAQSAQPPFAMNTMFGGPEPEISEDSLYLNVWTPACDDGRRPVMVWIHGGAFVNGAGDTPWYDGSQFVRNGDVVVVTINYRLGPFGFLHLADAFGAEFEGSGNAGILDQAAALEWVRDSIAGFGGDPENVTIFGESAGAGSVGTLLALPSARGLFHKAIAESGASSWWSSREKANDIATAFFAGLGVEPGDPEGARALTMQQLIERATAVGITSLSEGGLMFQPIVDGTTMPKKPLEMLDDGNARGVHVLTGTNRHEATLFNLLDPRLNGIEPEGVVDLLSGWSDERARETVAEYHSRRPDASGLELWTAIGTDAVFRIPAIRMAEAQRNHGPVWMYWFTWETPVFGGVLRSTHALEIPFVFDTLASAQLFTGDGAELQGIADAMHRAWIAFARTGDPNHDGIPTWPQYDLDRRATMRFDATVDVVDDPDGEDRTAWGDYRH